MEVINKIEQQSQKEPERTLISIFLEIASTIHMEKVTALDESTSRIGVNLPNEVITQLQRVKELISHTHPNASYADIIAFLAKNFLDRKDPLTQKERKAAKASPPTSNTKPSITPVQNSAAAAQRVPVRATARRLAIQRAHGRCEYRDPKSGRVCGRLQIEIDHIIPRALGGSNDPENLRCLCKKHNLLMSEQMLGLDLANAWRLEHLSQRNRIKYRRDKSGY